MTACRNNRDEAREQVSHFIYMAASELCRRADPGNHETGQLARYLDIYPDGRQIVAQTDQALQNLARDRVLQTDAARIIFAAMLVKTARGRDAWPEQDLPEQVMKRVSPHEKTLCLDTGKIETAARIIINRTLARFATRPTEDLLALKAILRPQP